MAERYLFVPPRFLTYPSGPSIRDFRTYPQCWWFADEQGRIAFSRARYPVSLLRKAVYVSPLCNPDRRISDRFLAMAAGKGVAQVIQVPEIFLPHDPNVTDYLPLDLLGDQVDGLVDREKPHV